MDLPGRPCLLPAVSLLLFPWVTPNPAVWECGNVPGAGLTSALRVSPGWLLWLCLAAARSHLEWDILGTVLAITE